MLSLATLKVKCNSKDYYLSCLFTLVSKELWDMCQEQKAIRAGQFLRTNDKNSLYQALVTCGITNRQCPCELKKGMYSYVTCWKKDNSRIYIRE